MKINWKAIAHVGLNIGEQLFPTLSIVEHFGELKNMSSKEKQNLAFSTLHDDLIKQLLPGQAQDPRLEAAIRQIIDDGVALNNLIAELKHANSDAKDE